jgi:hypothetical protein
VTCVPGVPALGALGGCPGKRLLWRRTYLTFGKANPPFGFALTRVTVLYRMMLMTRPPTRISKYVLCDTVRVRTVEPGGRLEGQG